MELKTRLIEVLDTAWAEEQAFVAGLSESERTAAGCVDCWSAKDTLAHLAAWSEHLAATLAGQPTPLPPDLFDDIDRLNAAIFERHAGKSWDEVMAFAGAAHAQLLAQLASLDDAALRDTARYPRFEGQPAWRRIAGNGYMHPMMHFASYYASHGQGERALAIWEGAAVLLDPLEDSPFWHGLNRYNIACGYALAGKKGQAIGTLREALELRPDLRDWARQDPDLACLADEPAFRELLPDE